jgi:hypothetical protein
VAVDALLVRRYDSGHPLGALAGGNLGVVQPVPSSEQLGARSFFRSVHIWS